MAGRTLYTIGFSQKSARQFFGLLMENGVKKLIDIRLNNKSFCLNTVLNILRWEKSLAPGAAILRCIRMAILTLKKQRIQRFFLTGLKG